MRILIHFLDGEVVEAQSDSFDQSRLTFVASPRDGNNALMWVSLAAVKYIVLPDAPIEAALAADPRAGRGFTKVVVRFNDGEVVRAYKDEGFSQEGHCFNVRLWNQETGKVARAIVSLHTLKAIFFVKEWDSRALAERAATA